MTASCHPYIQSRIETVVPFSGNCRPGDQLAGEHPRHHGPLLPQDRRVAVVAAGVNAVGGRDSGGGQVQLRQPHTQAAGEFFFSMYFCSTSLPLASFRWVRSTIKF